jgi:hypothetical protein
VIGVVLIAGDQDPVTGVSRRRKRSGIRESVVKPSRGVTLSPSKGERAS